MPWFSMKNIEETKKFYNERYAAKYEQPQAYAYAICLKKDNFPIGYINVDMDEHHDFGYGLRKEFWHKRKNEITNRLQKVDGKATVPFIQFGAFLGALFRWWWAMT